MLAHMVHKVNIFCILGETLSLDSVKMASAQ